MYSTITQEILRKVKWLGIYQIAGGIVGLALTLWSLVSQDSVAFFLILLFLIAIGLYTFSIYCGYLLINNKNEGFTYSLINQYLQLINFSILGYSFQYVSGVFLSVGIDLTNQLQFKFNLGFSTWRISVAGNHDEIILNFNIAALVIISIIEKLNNKLKEQKYNSAFSNTKDI